MIPLHDLNPRRRIRVPWVTLVLIGANVLAFLYELSLGPHIEAFLLANAFVPAEATTWTRGGPVAGGEVLWNALLSLFLHGGLAHLGGNMLFLWIFGDNIEDRLGHFPFLVFYLLAGFAATLAHTLANPGSALPAIGASGAISGVLGAYLLLHPQARIVTLVFLGFFISTVRIPALVYLPLWFLLQFVSGVASLGADTAVEAGGVAWFAHIGGFIAGPLLLLVLGGWRRR